MEDKEKENKSKDQLSGEDNKKTKETSDHNIEDVSKGMPDVTDKEQQQNVDEVALLDETGDSETVIPVSSSSEKVNNADSSDILNTSNESEATEPAMGSFNKGEETKDVLKEKLSRFLEWCIVNGLVLSNKVSVEFEGTSHRYGMVAKEDIKKSETLFKIPRKLLLEPTQGSLSYELKEYDIWLRSIGRSFEDSSGWVPLLITLMYEFKKEDSFWKPYLDLIPEIGSFGHPLFWKEEEIKRELSGMALLYDLLEDRKNIEEEYKVFVLPFLLKNSELASRIETFDMKLFKRMIAFVMAYSFSEDQESPSMIPMADMLNHHSNNNAFLMFERNSLEMISCRKIEKGEEIFNTFGKLGNAELLQMYGYTEDNNNFDTFNVSVQAFLDAVEDQKLVPLSYINAMAELLQKSEIAMSFDVFVFDKNGMRRGPELTHFLKILHLSEEDFEMMLKKRAGHRANSFYQKLLRKLRLSKKTDTSTGVAIIDITEDDNDTEPINDSKRSIDCEEIDDNDTTNGSSPPCKKQCLYDGTSSGECPSGDNLPLSHFDKPSDKLNHFVAASPSALDGKPASDPIIIIDEDDEDEDVEKEEEDGESKTKDKQGTESKKNKEINKDNKAVDMSVDNVLEKDILANVDNQKESVTIAKSAIVEDTGNKDNACTNNEKDITKAEDEKKSEKSPHTVDEQREKNCENESENPALILDTSSSKDSDVVSNETKTHSSSDEEKMKEGSNSDSSVTESKNEAEKASTQETNGTSDELEVEPVEESDEDEIEIISEDIRCIFTYEQLNNILKPEWRETMKRVLQKQLSFMKSDDDVITELAKETFTRDEYNAYNVRIGQRNLIRAALQHFKS